MLSVLEPQLLIYDGFRVQVCIFHDGCKQGIDQQFFNRKSISRKITHPQEIDFHVKLRILRTSSGLRMRNFT